MNNKNLVYGFIGLIVGFLLGAIIIGSNEGMQDSLFGTAGDNADSKEEDILYYQVDLPTAQTWLAEQAENENEGDNEGLDTSVEGINDIITAPDLQRYFVDSQENVNNVLASFQNQIGKNNTDFQACLAIYNDPYSTTGPKLYLYLQVPQSMTDDIPEEWEESESPLAKDMLWSFSCYQVDEDK